MMAEPRNESSHSRDLSTVFSILDSLVNQVITFDMPLGNSPITATEDTIILTGQCNQSIENLNENCKIIKETSLDISKVGVTPDGINPTSIYMENQEQKETCSQDDFFLPESEKETLIHALDLSAVKLVEKSEKPLNDRKESVHFNSPISVLYEYHVSPVDDNDTQSLGESNRSDSDDTNTSQDAKLEQKSSSTQDEDYWSKAVLCSEKESQDRDDDIKMDFKHSNDYSLSNIGKSEEENSEDLFAANDPPLQIEDENNILPFLKDDNFLEGSESHETCSNNSEILPCENMLSTSEISDVKISSAEETEHFSLVSCVSNEVNENQHGKRKLTEELVDARKESKKLKASQEERPVFNTCKVQNKRKLFKFNEEKGLKMAKLDLEHDKDHKINPMMLKTIVAEHLSCSEDYVQWANENPNKSAYIKDQKQEENIVMHGTCLSVGMKNNTTLCFDGNSFSEKNEGNLEFEDTDKIVSQNTSNEVTKFNHNNSEESIVGEDEQDNLLLEQSDNLNKNIEIISKMNFSNQLNVENNELSEQDINSNDSNKICCEENFGVCSVDENTSVDAKMQGNNTCSNVIFQDDTEAKETENFDRNNIVQASCAKDDSQSIDQLLGTVSVVGSLDVTENGASEVLLDEQSTYDYNKAVHIETSRYANVQLLTKVNNSTMLKDEDVKEDSITTNVDKDQKVVLAENITSQEVPNQNIEGFNTQFIENDLVLRNESDVKIDGIATNVDEDQKVVLDENITSREVPNQNIEGFNTQFIENDLELRTEPDVKIDGITSNLSEFPKVVLTEYIASQEIPNQNIKGINNQLNEKKLVLSDEDVNEDNITINADEDTMIVLAEDITTRVVPNQTIKGINNQLIEKKLVVRDEDVNEDNIIINADEDTEIVLAENITTRVVPNQNIKGMNNQFIENNLESTVELIHIEDVNFTSEKSSGCADFEKEIEDVCRKDYTIGIGLKSIDDSCEIMSESETTINHKSSGFEIVNEHIETRNCQNELPATGVENIKHGKCLDSEPYKNQCTNVKESISRQMFDDFTEKYDLNKVADMNSPDVCEFMSAAQVLSQSSQCSGSTGFVVQSNTQCASEDAESQESLKYMYITFSKPDICADTNITESWLNEKGDAFESKSGDELNQTNFDVANEKKNYESSFHEHKRTLLLECGDEGLVKEIVHSCSQSNVHEGMADYCSRVKTDMINQDEQLDIENLDLYIEKAVDQLVPDHDMTASPEQNPSHTDDEPSLYMKQSDKKVHMYACDADLHDDSDTPVCSPVEKTAKSRESCFQWKYTPSCDQSPESGVPELPDEDHIVRITPLNSCSKPLRLGLSKRQTVHSLHKISVHRVYP
ncbi:uncharacterized protein LOC127861937 isoform X2 [Dreissena polymorpha]|uniref:Uncharacterized protein n=1 Tax=Dreissena polymorpha TaxID=45954 RepID=A0A9D4BJU7_DREPO|nr:uncharacterized protein LOC127861937 isoform X2 [Dreissena polymorpha]KAH3695978.1 hypothetical protein DPMN_083437 [Dreissena polymorpha]